jgi:hypothetical protein
MTSTHVFVEQAVKPDLQECSHTEHMFQDVGEEHSNDGAAGASPDADSEDKSEVPSLKQCPVEVNDAAVEDVAVELKHVSQVVASLKR